MEHLRKLRLLDESGNPLDTRVEGVLTRFVQKVQRHFPALRDDQALTEVLEEAGRRIASRELRTGPIEKLHGYAWVTLRSVATSWMRRGSSRLAQKTLASEEGRSALATVPTDSNSPEQIERNILFREVLAQLTAEERLVCIWKKAGFSSQEIARHRGCSVGAVDILFFRTKEKIRRILGVQVSGGPGHEPAGPRDGNGSTLPSLDGTDFERPDAESSRAPRSIRLHTGR